MADLTRTGLNYKKREICVAVSEELTGADINDGAILFNLPDKTVVVGIKLMVTTLVADDTIDITYAGNVIGDEISTAAAGVIDEPVTAANAYSETGGPIVAVDGSAAVATTFRGRLIIEYLELEKTTGEYTNWTEV